MTILIKSRIPDINFEKEVEYPNCVDDGSLVMDNGALFDSIHEEIWELYTDIISACPVVPRGSFVESDIYDFFCGHAKEYINANQNRWIAECSQLDENGNATQSELLNITGLLLEMLDSDSSTGEFDAYLSGYVEECFLEFVKNSSWHIEEDCLWFGIDKPLPAWLINSETKQEDLAFWFEAEPWIIMRHLGDFSDCFLIWYTAECECWAPDMSEISSNCPIQFAETDTVKSILEKAAAWCSENRE